MNQLIPTHKPKFQERNRHNLKLQCLTVSSFGLLSVHVGWGGKAYLDSEDFSHLQDSKR